MQSKNFSLVIFCLIFLLSENAFSSGLTLRCKSGWFNSVSLVQKGETYFLDGVKYPDYTEKINSSGWLWAKMRVARNNGGQLELLTATKNVKTEYISKVEFFVLNLQDFSFQQGVNKKKRRRLSEKISDWIGETSGKCETVRIN